MINAAYSLLGLQTYFTAGVKEVRAWTVRKGATAPQAAAVIHTDFEKGFIRAETIAYDDFIKYKGEAGAKEAGPPAPGRQGVPRAGRRHPALPLQRLILRHRIDPGRPALCGAFAFAVMDKKTPGCETLAV